MRLLTLEKTGAITSGIQVTHGFFRLGDSKGTETLVQVLGAQSEVVMNAVTISEKALRVSSEASDLANPGPIGLLIRNQSRGGELWELRGNLVSKCPMSGENDYWKRDKNDSSPLECPKCFYPVIGWYPINGYDLKTMTHSGYVFERVPMIRPTFSGYVSGEGPEYFLVVEPGMVFSVHRRFPRKYYWYDLIVSYESGDLTFWTPERYLEWRNEGHQLICYIDFDNIDNEVKTDEQDIK